MMRCLVTGGAGFIGANLVRSLLQRGDEVAVLDNFSTGLRENLESVQGDIELFECDLRDAEAVKRACEGREVVFHEGAMPSVPRSVDEPRASFEINAGGTLNVLLAAKESGVRRVVYAASSSAYGDTPVLPKHEGMPHNPQSPYAADKVHGENLCKVFTRVYGLECVALRYFNVFGPLQRPDSAYAAVIPKFIRAAMDGVSPIVHGDGGQSRDFTYIDNVVRINQLAAEAPGAPGRVFNVGAGGRTSLLELLELIGNEFGTKIVPEFTETRAGDVRDSQADISLAREHLGYDPDGDLAAGIAQTVAWFRTQAQNA